MNPTAIVYTSNTGFTARYAAMLGEKTGLPVYEFTAANKALTKGTPVIYMGWLMANSVKDYKKAAKRYHIRAVVGVGLCPTGQLLSEVRKAISLPDATPLFTVQGGMDRQKLTGVYGFAINMLVKMLKKQKDPTEEDKAKLSLIENGGDFVDEANLAAPLAWLAEVKA